MKNKYIDIIINKKFIKLNKLNIYILCFTLILSLQFFLSGCASNSLFSNNSTYSYNNSGMNGNVESGRYLENNEETGYDKKTEKLKKALENSVLYYSLKLNKVSEEKIKNLKRSEIYGHKYKKERTGLNNYYIKPSFMAGEYGIKNDAEKNKNGIYKKYNTNAKRIKAQSALLKVANKNSKVNTAAVSLNQNTKESAPISVKLNKTVKSDGDKIVLKVTGVKYDGILEIISFSLSNFNKSFLRYKPLLLKESGKNKYIEIPFKSNIKNSGGKNYFTLSGLSKINGKLICMRITKDKNNENKQVLRKTVLFIEALYKNGYGGVKFIKLPVRL